MYNIGLIHKLEYGEPEIYTIVECPTCGKKYTDEYGQDLPKECINCEGE